MTFYWPAILGFFFGFAFGVGCALAVMYSIYRGGYRAAVRDSQLPNPPESYRKAMEKIAKILPKPTGPA
ncbi:hypothetical protein [Granulicella sp. dw_53]|uniref:hypothetical protein n=1 Tax=Granulicella sp. dw_53 TaxID=2719792 RepID=UPI001BD2BE37|nr:hypothetical protein [Granulicella sp. dw_53]